MTKIATRDKESKQPWTHRAKGLGRRALRMTAAAALAIGGEKARELSNEINDVADTVAPPPPPPVEPPRLADSQLFMSLRDRVDVVSKLGRLTIDCMNGYGWSHVLTLPVEPAAQLIESVQDVLAANPAWRDRVLDCYGFSQTLKDSADALARVGNEQTAGGVDAETANSAMMAARRQALFAIERLWERLQRLVWAYDEYARGREPSINNEPTAEAPRIEDDPFR